VDKALNYLSLARKAGKAELGEEPAGAAARALHAHLIVVAGDASDHTWRRAKSYVAGTDQSCIRLPYTKDEIGMAIGRTSLAIAAITDPALALALVQSLPTAEKFAAVIDALTEKAQRQRKRQSEAKAHLRNRRSGKKKN
jgi:ribosomal protein L7Ae-like RNA K-turn-binding protein